MQPAARLRGRIFVALLCAAGVSEAGQTLYRYQDQDGNWVYTDKRPPEVAEFDEQRLASPAHDPRVTVRSEEKAGEETTLMVSNEYVAPVEILLELTDVEGVARDVPAEVHSVVPPSSETAVLDVRPQVAGSSWSFGYRFQYMPGDPAARHSPPAPYRAPFASATSFVVSQAYPSDFSHKDAANRFAVDFAMPVGTRVYAARGGKVMDVATHFFKSGTDTADGTRANLVRVVQDDGTMAIYAHLNWDSIRVRPGETIERGQYLADSGNTGFSTGPHLHFVVQRNVGLALESVPVEFVGPDGQPVSVRTGERLEAY